MIKFSPISSASAATTLELAVVAGEGLSGHVPVYIGGDGKAYAASRLDDPGIGITAGAASINATVTVVVSGRLNGFSGLTPGAIYWLAVEALAADVPETGLVQAMGWAISATAMCVEIDPPVYV